jgi:hypothetical protein
MEFGVRIFGWQLGRPRGCDHSVWDIVKVASLSDDGWTIFTHRLLRMRHKLALRLVTVA